MFLGVEQLGGASAVDGDRAGVVPRRIRPLHLVVDVLGLDEGVVGGETRWMETVAQHEYRRHRVRQPARVIVKERDEHFENIDEAPHPPNLNSIVDRHQCTQCKRFPRESDRIANRAFLRLSYAHIRASCSTMRSRKRKILKFISLKKFERRETDR